MMRVTSNLGKALKSRAAGAGKDRQTTGRVFRVFW
jgi:hypothetical protein